MAQLNPDSRRSTESLGTLNCTSQPPGLHETPNQHITSRYQLEAFHWPGFHDMYVVVHLLIYTCYMRIYPHICIYIYIYTHTDYWGNFGLEHPEKFWGIRI